MLRFVINFFMKGAMVSFIKLSLGFCFFSANIFCSSSDFKLTIPPLNLAALSKIDVEIPVCDQTDRREATVSLLKLEKQLNTLLIRPVTIKDFVAISLKINRYRKKWYIVLQENALCSDDSEAHTKENMFNQRLLAPLNQLAQKHQFEHDVQPIQDQSFEDHNDLKKLFEL